MAGNPKAMLRGGWKLAGQEVISLVHRVGLFEEA